MLRDTLPVMSQFEREIARAKEQQPDIGLDVPRLRVVSIVAPATFVAGLLVAAVLLTDDVPLPLLISVGVLASTAAAALFSAIVFDVVERSESRLVESNQQLAAFRVAAMSLAQEYELGQMLQRFVDTSRQLTSARYSAMSIVRDDGSIEQFITSGVSEEERARIGHPPVGRGLLGAIREGALRIDDMSRDPRSVGFPPHHPPMRSLLGVPVQARGGTLGNLYLTDKIDAEGFSEADEQMVRTFAAHAALAIETARLHDEARTLDVLRERERIGMDLHDGIIQSIYAVELGLEGVEEDLETDIPAARSALATAIEQLNGVIRDVRSYIFELRPAKLSYDISESMLEMVDEFRLSTGAHIEVDVAAALPPLGETQRLALFHIARDALVNAQRHARASRIEVSLHANLNSVNLLVRDNGQGFDLKDEMPEQHRGLRNMAARADAAGGALTVESAPGVGTTVGVELPIRREEGERA
jgi:signal transduction histidine kinase